MSDKQPVERYAFTKHQKTTSCRVYPEIAIKVINLDLNKFPEIWWTDWDEWLNHAPASLAEPSSRCPSAVTGTVKSQVCTVHSPSVKSLSHRKHQDFRKILVPNGTDTTKSFPGHIVRGGTRPLYFWGKLIILGLSVHSFFRHGVSCSGVAQAASWADVSEGNRTCYWTHRLGGTHRIFKFPKENSIFSCKTYIFPSANFSSVKIASPSRKFAPVPIRKFWRRLS